MSFRHVSCEVFVLTLGVLTPAYASAWTLTADFEGGTIGAKAQSPNPDAFHGTAGDSKYVGSPVNTGSQAGSVTAQAGQTGFGKWGGSFDFPTDLKQGDEVWFRVYVHYPAGWSFNCGGCTQGMKFMRIHTASPSGSNEGYQDILIKGGATGGLIEASCYEVNGSECHTNNNNGALLHGLGTAVPRDKWQAFEQYVKWSSVPGQGIFRFWQDGKLIFEDLKTATLRTANSKSDFIYMYTYWNNGAPKTQTSYVDSVVITTDTPGQKDSQGNPFIGLVSAAPNLDAGVGGAGGGGTGGAGGAGTAGASGASAGGTNAGGASGAGAAGAGGGAGNPALPDAGDSGAGGTPAQSRAADSDDGGCSCRTRGRPSNSGEISLLALLGAMLLRRKRMKLLRSTQRRSI
jgi:MYXO-CTERM domain-containing protein